MHTLALLSLCILSLRTDVRADTVNIDETLIEAAITDKTKAICAVHYGGERYRKGKSVRRVVK